MKLEIELRSFEFFFRGTENSPPLKKRNQDARRVVKVVKS